MKRVSSAAGCRRRGEAFQSGVVVANRAGRYLGHDPPFRATAVGSQTWIFGIGEPALRAYQQFISACYQSATCSPAMAGAEFGRSEREADYQTISVTHPEGDQIVRYETYQNLLFSIYFIDFRINILIETCSKSNIQLTSVWSV